MQHFPVTCEALHLFAMGVGFVQFRAISVLLFAVAMAVQTRSIGHLAWLFDLAFMTGLIATCLVGNKFGMVNFHESTLDDRIWHFVTALAIGLDNLAVTLIALEKMACKTYIAVQTEVLISYDMAVTCAARDTYPVNDICDMVLMCELYTMVVDIF